MKRLVLNPSPGQRARRAPSGTVHGFIPLLHKAHAYREVSDGLGRHPCPQLATGHRDAHGDDRPRRDPGVLLHHGVVQHAGPGADEAFVLQLASMDDRIGAHEHVVADDGGRIALDLGHVQNGAVSHSGVLADGDVVHVGADRGAIHDRRALSNLHLANDSGRRRHKDASADLGLDALVAHHARRRVY
eukprot:scaffold1006_cov270-Pinguiococcus_pyrenoidosus.AAC.30